MLLNVRSTTTARRLGVMTFAAAMAAATAGLGAGIAQAAPGEDITEECLETSLDGGATWTDLAGFTPGPGQGFTDYVPVPGDERSQLAFDVRNTCGVPAKFVMYSESWTVGDDATATVRGAIDGVEGEQFEIGAGHDASQRIVLKEKELDTDAKTGVDYILGIPGEEEVQGNKIDANWGFVLVELEADQAAPSAPADLSSSGGEVEKDQPVTISGTAEPGTTVTVSGDGRTCTATADEAGAFSCELTFDSEGQKSITATADYGNGTSAPSEPITVTVTEADDGSGGDDGGDGDDNDSGGSGSLGSLDFGSLDLFGSLGLK